jgi:hypothetical protein
VDDNQAQVVAALRKAGATVQPLHTIGKGCPDLLVGFRQVNLLLEVKDGQKPPSARKLTPDEKAWIGSWRAPVYIVNSPEQALTILETVKP